MQIPRDLDGSVLLWPWGGAFDVADNLALFVIPAGNKLRVEGALGVDDLEEFWVGGFVGGLGRGGIGNGIFLGVFRGHLGSTR